MQYALNEHETTPTYSEPELASDMHSQHQLRVLIDNLATTRGLTIQMSLRAMAYVASEQSDARGDIQMEFEAMAFQFDQNLELLFGTDAVEDWDKDRVAWLRGIVAQTPDREAKLRNVQRSIANMNTRIQGAAVIEFDEVRQFYAENWPVVRDEMTALIWDLWADMDKQRDDAVLGIEKLSETLSTTLDDIKRISMTVRMISLNAAVLASRAGEKGAGFSVIATEVRSLAEKIQSSANRANSVLKDMNVHR